MIVLNVIIIPTALIFLNYLTKKFFEKQTVPERILNISFVLLCGIVLYIATDGVVSWLF